MRSRVDVFAPAALAGLLLLAAVAPDAFAYKGKQGGFDGGGGILQGGTFGTVATLGGQTSGPASSAAHRATEGLLAFFGQPLLVAVPGTLDFGPVAVGGSRLLSATVDNYGGVSLLLSDIRLASAGSSSFFTLEGPGTEATIGPGAAQSIGVRFAPADTPLERDTLVANTNDPFRPVWRLPLSGSGLGPAGPAIAIGPDTLDFGRVPIDSVAARTVTIENVGSADLVVGSIAASESAFSASASSFALSPGSSRDVVVWLEPEDATVFRESLLVSSNAPSSPFVVMLLGSVPSVLAVAEPDDGRLDFKTVLDAAPPDEGEIRLRNDGAELLRWEAHSSGAAWLSIEPDSGSVPPGNTTILDVAVDHAGLSDGPYEASVHLRNRERPLSDADTVDVFLMVQPFSVAIASNPLVATEGGSVELSATASAFPDSGRVFYRAGGEEAFASSPMSPVGSSGLVAVLSGDALGIRGLEWYALVHAAGRSVVVPDPDTETPERVAVACAEPIARETPAGEYRTMSVPLATDAADPAETFEDDLGEPDRSAWRLGRWSGASGGVLEHPSDIGEPIDAGTGFWIITREEEKLTFGGRSVFPPAGEKEFAISLEAAGEGGAGWNQIGHPFAFPVYWADCRIRDSGGRLYAPDEAANEGLVENAAHAWQDEGGAGGYEAATLLEPWSGYFVNNISGGALELLVPMREAAPAKALAHDPCPIPEEGEWEIRVRAMADERRGGATIGARRGARAGWDAFDRFVPPPPDGEDALLSIASEERMPVLGRLGADVRAVSPEGRSWTLEVRPAGAREVRIALEGCEALPRGWTARLVDESNGMTAAGGAAAACSVVPRPGEAVRTLRLAVGPAPAESGEGSSESGAAPRFAVERPYPNPATTGTAVRYTVPSAGEVRIQIFSIEGRLVRDLSEGTAGAGERLVRWDARDERGREVGPGIYLLRFSRAGETRTARVVVFR